MNNKLQEQSVEQLHSRVNTLIKKRLQLRMVRASGQSESKDTSIFKKIRREIAQILTHLQERTNA